MARVELQTDVDIVEVALILNSEDVKLIVSTWDIPLAVKKALIEAKTKADLINT